MVGKMEHLLLRPAALGDVGVGSHHAAAGEGDAVDLHHVAAGAHPDVGLRFGDDAAPVVLGGVQRAGQAELARGGLVGDDLAEAGLGVHQLARQAEHVHRAAVAHHHGLVGVHHHDALVHVAQGGLQCGRLLGKQGLAGLQLCCLRLHAAARRFEDGIAFGQGCFGSGEAVELAHQGGEQHTDAGGGQQAGRRRPHAGDTGRAGSAQRLPSQGGGGKHKPEGQRTQREQPAASMREVGPPWQGRRRLRGDAPLRWRGQHAQGAFPVGHAARSPCCLRQTTCPPTGLRGPSPALPPANAGRASRHHPSRLHCYLNCQQLASLVYPRFQLTPSATAPTLAVAVPGGPWQL